ncbi:hypothetical protein [Micromonospora noduli]|uniref:hypothetical protein n=1 Tax=Micromonospora noduli TaxID=709876 RepID=UPI0011BD50B3|nr:hypothetical protein [Micromonospora noduli]
MSAQYWASPPGPLERPPRRPAFAVPRLAGAGGRRDPTAGAAAALLRQYPTQGATLALFKVTSDRAVADQHLAGRPEQLARDGITSALLTWLAEHGGLTARQHKQLRSLIQASGFGQLMSAGKLWLHDGPLTRCALLLDGGRDCVDLYGGCRQTAEEI